MNELTAAFKGYAAGTLLVLSFAAASAGCIMRDPLIGAVPPAAISDWRYLAVSLLAGLVTFFWYPVSERLHKLRNHVLVLAGRMLNLPPAAVAVAGTTLCFGIRLVAIRRG